MADQLAQAMRRPDLRSLPFGLTRYRPGVFEKLHACGSKTVTASLVSALFNESRWTGRFAAMCHMAGLVPLKNFGNEALKERGITLESTAINMVAEERNWICGQAKAWKAHGKIQRLVASPDAVAWKVPDLPPGIGEIKVVADWIFDRDWLDGPPIDVVIQHQTQFACTGADWGFIAALVVGAVRWDLIIYDTTPDPDAIKLIEGAVTSALADLDRGDMGLPDEHRSSIAAARSLWAPEPGQVLSINDPDADEHFSAWVAARDRRLAAEKEEARHEAYFAARALNHALIQCPGGGQVKISRYTRPAFSVDETEVTKLVPKPPRKEIEL